MFDKLDKAHMYWRASYEIALQQYRDHRNRQQLHRRLMALGYTEQEADLECVHIEESLTHPELPDRLPQ
jgi:hypothetical protein